ncbi:hypothetical protein, partial [Raoultella ornithinolytica]|uniref:hypothetical protein n=1 Tax=Raoultella ornithinolytica TaxID=54291 RepID=UPI00384F0459
NTDDLLVGKTLLHGDVLMWLMKTLLTSGCTNQRGAGHYVPTMHQITAERTAAVSNPAELGRLAPFPQTCLLSD